MSTFGPDFIGLQVSDLERSATFYERHLGLTRGQTRPDAIVYFTEPIPMALRTPLPHTDLSAGPVGLGIAVWIRVSNTRELHDRLTKAGVQVLTSPSESPFGLHFTFRDPDGYAITIHDGQ
ncbi:VOC family protein [Corynebacterium sp. H128]|uniref:VOC family protein n=1 Tax=Corynebacterium sp. H128 TaxID=3133427 RepID=UPI0030A013C3